MAGAKQPPLNAVTETHTQQNNHITHHERYAVKVLEKSNTTHETVHYMIQNMFTVKSETLKILFMQ